MNYIHTIRVGEQDYAIGTVIDDATLGEHTWSARNIVDRLCPSFTEKGAMVTCQPVAGYPLTVTAEEGATTVTRCGKNLLADDWKEFDHWVQVPNTDKNQKTFSLDFLRPGTYCLWLDRSGVVYVRLEKSTDNGITWVEELYFSTDKSNKPVTFVVKPEEGVRRRIWCSGGAEADGSFKRITHMQIEWGSSKTEAEPYHGETFQVGEAVPALPGVNHLFADVGEVTVTGKADPSAMIEKLTNAILSLGGNV